MFYNYIGGVILFGLIYNEGREQSFQLPFRVRLDDVEGDILVLLSMVNGFLISMQETVFDPDSGRAC
jgi:hypothetical protein